MQTLSSPFFLQLNVLVDSSYLLPGVAIITTLMTSPLFEKVDGRHSRRSAAIPEGLDA